MSFLNCWFMAFLFCGVMLPVEDIIWPFRALTYVMPLRWAMSSISYLEYKDHTYKGAVLDDTDPRGFSCPNLPPQQCFGVTGPQVLRSMNVNFSVFDNEDTVGRDIALMLAFAVACKIGYALLVLRSTTRTKEPAAATPVVNVAPATVAVDVADDGEKVEARRRESSVAQNGVQDFVNEDLNANFGFKNLRFVVQVKNKKTKAMEPKEIISGIR